MRHIALALLIYLAAVAQTAVVPTLGLEDAAPNLPLLLLLPAALIGGVPGMVWAALIGTVSGAIAPSGLETQILLATSAVWFAQRWLRHYPADSMSARVILALALVGTIAAAGAVTRLSLAREAIVIADLAVAAGGCALSSALVVLVAEMILRVLRWVASKSAPHRARQHAW